MALNQEGVVAKVTALRDRAQERDTRQDRVLLVRQGKITQIYPDFFPDGVDTSVVANFCDIVAKDLSEVMAPLPSINCSAANMGDDKARKFADTRTRIASNYFINSDMSAHMYNFADRYLTYGFAAFVVELDKEGGLPRIRVEDSYKSYPEFDRYGRCVSFAKLYEITLGELIAQFPEHADALTKPNKNGQKDALSTMFELVRYYDKDQSVIYIPQKENLTVSVTPNPIGKMMVVVAQRPSIDGVPRGQFDDVLGIQVLRNRFAMLALEVVEKAVSAPLILPLDVQDLQLGADAILRTNNPAGVKKVDITLPQGAFAETANLSQELQTGARYPQSRTGNVNASVITGQGVQALMGAFDTQVKSFQTIVATTLREVIGVCFKVDEKVYNKKKTIRGVDAGAPFSIDYIPRKDIAGDHSVEVRYGMLAGLNPAQGLVFILQAMQGDLLSGDTAMRELPFNVDVTIEQEKIEVEKMRKSLLSAFEQSALSIPQMIAQGQDPSPIIWKIASVITERKGGKSIEEVAKDLFKAPPPPAPDADGQDQEGQQDQQQEPQGPPNMLGQQPGGDQGQQQRQAPPDIQQLITNMSSNGQTASSVRSRSSKLIQEFTITTIGRPKSVKIFGQKYTIRYDYDSTENNGLTDFDSNTIHVRPELPDDKLFRILMHEVTHAIINETPLCNRKRFANEEVCDIVGFHFIDMLKDNPALVAWLIEQSKE